MAFGPEELERLQWAVAFGELSGRAVQATRPAADFLAGWLDLNGGVCGYLSFQGPGLGVRLRSLGCDQAALAALANGSLEPPALAEAAANGGVALLPGAVAGTLLGLTEPQWPARGSLLRVATNGAGSPISLVVAFDVGSDGLARERLRMTAAVLPSLHAALERVTIADQVSTGTPTSGLALGAWQRCNVPLVFLHDDATVVAANPAAFRKLGLEEGDQLLPDWLGKEVRQRLRGMPQGRLPDDVSGAYAYVEDLHTETVVRLCLAPVDEQVAGEWPHWLLSVEAGGPSLADRIDSAERTFGLTPREADVLASLADGLANKQIAANVGVSEATVKFHMVSIMRKSETSNRTELLATLYSLTA